MYKALVSPLSSQGESTAESEHLHLHIPCCHGPCHDTCGYIMPSIPCFAIILALVFVSQVEPRAFPLAEATEAHDLCARQVATSATATATNEGSVAAGNLINLLAAGASMSSVSVEAAVASVAAVASTTEAEASICNADSDRNQTAWIDFDMGDWFKNKYARSLNLPLTSSQLIFR